MRRFALMVLIAVSGCGGSEPLGGPTAVSLDVGSAPATPVTTPARGDVQLSIETFDGIQDRIASHKGKVVVMDAWSTSCPPCMKEFHNLVDLHKKYGPNQVACVSLSFDYEGLDKPEEVKPRVLEFLQSQGATFDNLMSSEESDALYRRFKLAAVPAVFVYGRDGQLRKRFDNEKATSKSEAFTYEQVGALVAELLAEPAGPSE